MEALACLLKPRANIYTVLLIWCLTLLNIHFCSKPLEEYASSVGLKTTPVILDMLTYYTPDEGYQVLSDLGEDGRTAYRLTNYLDFILPIFLFLSLSVPNLAMGYGSRYIIIPFIYMISDYIENICEKYVLEIYPKRNDMVMTSSSYWGILKFTALGASMLILVINGLKWSLQSKQKVH